MAVRVAINGFGRIGRLAFRAMFDRKDVNVEVVHINDPGAPAATLAHLLKYDSIHGIWGHEVSATSDAIIVDGRKFSVSAERTIGGVDWKGKGVQVAIDASGRHRTAELTKPFFDAGVPKVLVSAPLKGEDGKMIVMGVNDDTYNPATDHLLSPASCTTNCLAPVVKVINDNLKIRHVTMTTIHSPTSSQKVVDVPDSDLRRARACSLSMIPTSTGAATAVTKVIPSLKGRINGQAVRVPSMNASLTDIVFELEEATSVETVNGLLKAASEAPNFKGRMGYTELPLVSIDYKTDSRSSIVDGPCTMVIHGTMVKVFSWYDNEWGYSNRLVECAQMVGSKM
ncbi:MAG: ArsJ-associated glyceraldehyde-3-phosphate dehydrogenase [Magnetococcus sp. WYHC-3]